MTSFINKFKIPTLLGLSIIILGIVTGSFLVLREQSFLSQASPSLTPQNITLSNIDDSQASISWQTLGPAASFVSFGQGSLEQTVLDDRDNNAPKPRLTHHVTVKNLQASITYQFKIVSSKISSDILKFTTAPPPSSQNGFQPVIGTVLDGANPLDDSIVYLSISGAITQSSLIKNLGNFLISISQMRKSDLSDVYQPTEGGIAKLIVISDKGQASALFNLKPSGQPLPPLKLGQNVDLTSPTISDLDKYDLNGDRLVNAADYSMVLQNFGKSPKLKKADLNSDGVVDQKDLDLMQKQINQ